MGLRIIVTRDYDHMSKVAAEILLPEIQQATSTGFFNLGTATGNSPSGLYDLIVEHQHSFYAANVRTWGLDEYVLSGLPDQADPRSYNYEMNKKLWNRLDPPLAETSMPEGLRIDPVSLERALTGPHELVGSEDGKAIRLLEGAENTYLEFIQTELMRPYVASIEQNGGIDYWIVGAGEESHIGFHERGIPLDYEMLLVMLSENTTSNSVEEGHMTTRETPIYALSMGASAIARLARNVLFLAPGIKRRRSVTELAAGKESEEYPITILSRYIPKRHRHAICVADEEAAQDILSGEINPQITLQDIRKIDEMPYIRS